MSEGQTQNDKILQAINMVSQNKPEPQASNKEGPLKRSTGHREKKKQDSKTRNEEVVNSKLDQEEMQKELSQDKSGDNPF